MNFLRSLFPIAIALFATPSAASDLVLPFFFDRHETPVIQLDLGGKTHSLHLDTGSAEGLHLTKDTLNRIEGVRLTGETQRSLDFAGNVQENACFVIDELSINGRIFRNIKGVEFSPWGIAVRKDTEPPKSQVVGLGFFNGERILIDYAAKELTIFDASADAVQGGEGGWVEIPFRRTDDGLVLKAQIAGKKHEMALDSGATLSFVFADRIADTRSAVPCETIYPDGLGQEECWLIPVETEFGGVPQTVHAFMVKEDQGIFGGTGLLGGDFLKNNAVLIDLANERMYIRPARNPVVATETPEHFESR